MDDKIIFERKAYSKLLEWKNKYAPDYALFLKGARETGKTTLAEVFGKKEYSSYIKIDFTNADSELKNLFIDGLMDLDSFFTALEFVYKTKLYPGKSLIILDGVQHFPKARQALKVLVQDKRYHYIETGSLEKITKKSTKNKILIPSEEDSICINPLDFDEFLTALGRKDLSDIINDFVANLRPIPNVILKELIFNFRLYMSIGGMPQAVARYIETKDFTNVDHVKRQIIELYKQDMKEQGAVPSDNLFNLFENIPSELSKLNKQYILSHADKNARYSRYEESIGWLEDAQVINVARCVSEPSTALSLSLSDTKFKMYLLDTGLLLTLAYDDGSPLTNEFYESILKDKLHVNEGMLLENIVAQGLTSIGKKLRYNIKIDKERRKTVREIDFLIKDKFKIVPIEVKSSDKNIETKSLDDFLSTYSSITDKGIVFYPGNIKKVKNVYYLPYFFAFYLDKINFS